MLALHRKACAGEAARRSGKRPRRVALAVVTSALISGASVAHANPPDPAAAFVQSFVERSVTVLNDQSLPRDRREAAFRKLLLEGFDTDLAGRLALGRGWAIANSVQQKEFLGLFRDDVLRLALRFFDEYEEGESLDVVRIVPVGGGDLMVRTRHSNPAVTINEVDFRLRRHGGGFRIVDVWLEGLSIVNLYRNEYINFIFEGGVEGLLEKLRRRPVSLTSLAFHPNR